MTCILFYLSPSDEKVSMVGKDKIQALAGGGEDSVAYMLLYRAAM